jgi:predicted DNA-binding transcriptional regulator AlpA
MSSATMITAPHSKGLAPLFLRMKDLPSATALSLSTVSRLRRQGRLPSPDAQFGRCLCWKPSTIERWVDAGGLVGDL